MVRGSSLSEHCVWKTFIAVNIIFNLLEGNIICKEKQTKLLEYEITDTCEDDNLRGLHHVVR